LKEAHDIRDGKQLLLKVKQIPTLCVGFSHVTLKDAI